MRECGTHIHSRSTLHLSICAHLALHLQYDFLTNLHMHLLGEVAPVHAEQEEDHHDQTAHCFQETTNGDGWCWRNSPGLQELVACLWHTVEPRADCLSHCEGIECARIAPAVDADGRL